MKRRPHKVRLAIKRRNKKKEWKRIIDRFDKKVGASLVALFKDSSFPLLVNSAASPKLREQDMFTSHADLALAVRDLKVDKIILD